MLTRAHIVVAETRDGQIRPIHSSFDAVKALDEFNLAGGNAEFAEVAMIAHGSITRIRRPANDLNIANAIAKESAPPAPTPKSKKKT